MNKNKLPLKNFVSEMFRKYIIIFILICSFIFIVVKSVFPRLIDEFYYDVDELNLKEYTKISNEFLLDENMTLEVLDSNLNVIESRGIPGDVYNKYTPNEFFKLLSSDAYKMDVLHTTITADDGNEYIVILKQYLTRHDMNRIKKLLTTQTSLLILGVLVSALLLFKLYVNKITKTLHEDFAVFKENLSHTDLMVDTSNIKIGELDKLAQHLNNIVHEKKVLESEKEKLDLQSNQLISSLSHDLKSPITTILGYSKLLVEENLSPETSSSADYIHKAAEELNLMSNMLFDQVKYNNNSFKLNKVELNVGELLEDICAEKYPLFEAKNFHVEFKIDTSRKLLIDEFHFKRAVSNIINNLIEHNPPGTCSVICSYTSHASYVIEVKDNGIGIAPDIKDFVFSPFFSSDTSRNSHCGLGLFITRQIINKHGGKLLLLSDDSFKTIFKIMLPL